MKKWLVGLMAAGLCAASAWAVTDTLTAGDFEATSTTYKDFSGVTKDSGAVYAGNSGKTSDGAIQLRSNNNNSGIVTTGSGGTATKVTVAWNENTDGKRTLDVYGKTEAYTAATDLYSKDADTQGTKLGSLNKENGDTELAIDGEYTFIGLRSSSGAMYLDSISIEWGGEPTPVEFSIALDPAEDFEVVQGKSASITAKVKGAQGDVSYSWSVDGTPIDLLGNVYDINSEEVGGPYEVACEASDGVSDPVSASVKYSVIEAPVVTGDQLTRETTGVTGTSYKDWTATGDSGTVYAGNSAGGNSSIQLNTGSPKGIVITESTGKDVASVTVEWNDATVAARSLEIYGSANAYEGPADLYGDSKGELLGTIARDATTLEVAAGYPYVGILAKGGALYLSSVTIGFAGEAGLAVTLDKANGFTVDLGTADSIKAEAKNGTEPYSYVWTSDTAELNGTGDTLAIPATLAEGDYTVQVEVTDADSNKTSKQIGFTVAAPLEPHAINIAVGIQNGTVTSDPEGEAVKGIQVKLTATATTEGYALKEMTVTYGETVLTFTSSPATFEMPDEAVSVGATFVEVKDFAELPFVAEDTPYSGPWKGATVDGLTSKGLGDDYKDGSAKLDSANDWIQVKFTGTPGALSFGIKGNSLGEEKPSTFLVQESADGTEWSTLETYTTGDKLTGERLDQTLELSATSQFVRFFYETKGAGNVGIYDVYISSGGPATFSIKLDPASYFEVEVDAEAAITATPKNAEGEVHYSWTVGGEPAGGDSAVLGLDTTAATDELEVVCKATDAANTIATAKVSYKVVAPAPKFQIECAVGIPNGSVSADKTEAEEGELVTLTAKPDAGYKLEHFLLDGIAFTENPFPMPARDVLVSASFVEITGETYTLVESAEDFEEGADYLIVAYSKDKFTSALKNEPSDKRIAVDEVVISEEKTVVTDSDAIVWTISAGAEGKYTLFNAAKGVYAAAPTAASANEARLIEDGTDETAQWTIDIAEDALVTIGSLHEGKALQRNSTAANAYFANYKSGTKPFLFKKAGASKPSITFTGETMVKIPGSFSIQFTLKNYDGSFTWVNDGREGGEISAEGLYTWTPSEEGDVTITVKAMSGETEIASKPVALTVLAADPDQPEVECEDAPTGAVEAGKPLTLTFTAKNFTVAPGAWYMVIGEDSIEPDSISEDGQTATFIWTPSGTGRFTLEATAHEDDGTGGWGTAYSYPVEVTVGGEPGPVGGPYIKSIKVDATAKTVTLTLADPTGKVRTTADLVTGTWELNDTAATDGTLELPMDGSPMFYGAP